MTDFTVHTIETAPEAARATLRSVAATYGFLPNLHAVLAESPVALQALEAVFAALETTSLSPAERQVAMLTVSVANACDYCTMGHTYLARMAGLDEPAIAALRAGRAPQDPAFEALHVFTRALVERRGAVTDAEVEAFLDAGFTRETLFEVIAIVAAKTIANYANVIAKTPRDAFMADPALAWSASRPTVDA